MAAPEPNGALLGGPARPNDELDNIATAFANEVKGGNHGYATIAERDGIIEERREWGMLCSVYNNTADPLINGVYVLSYNKDDTDITNNLNWVKTTLPSGQGGGPGTGVGGGGGSITGADNIGDDLNGIPGQEVFLQENAGVLEFKKINFTEGIIVETTVNGLVFSLDLDKIEEIMGCCNTTPGGNQTEALFRAVKNNSQNIVNGTVLAFENDTAPDGYDYGQCWSGFDWQNTTDLDMLTETQLDLFLSYSALVYIEIQISPGGFGPNVATQAYKFVTNSNTLGTIQFNVDNNKAICARNSVIQSIDAVSLLVTVVTEEPHGLDGACLVDILNTGTTLDVTNQSVTVVDLYTFTYATTEADQSGVLGNVVNENISSVIGTSIIQTDVQAGAGTLATDLQPAADQIIQDQINNIGFYQTVPTTQSGIVSGGTVLFGPTNYKPGDKQKLTVSNLSGNLQGTIEAGSNIFNVVV
jgi:hypothetical protein